MTYTFNLDGSVVRDSDGLVIQTDPTSKYYLDYLDWLASGGKASAAPIQGYQIAQINVLISAYQKAIQQPVNYTSKGGIAAQYQADPASVANLSQMLLAFQTTGAVPNGFYWIAADNTKVPFTYADMQSLAQIMGTQGAAAFQKLQTLKAQVLSATTAADIEAIGWN